jgi:hypothetical protein
VTSDEYIQHLAKKGDPLERAIVLSRDALHQAVDPYASIWADHIEPRRLKDNPTKVEPAWMDFAGSHYTALVRVYQAYMKLEEINSTIGEMMAGDERVITLIKLHDLTAGFWEHIGACIDNLAACWTDAPPLRVKHAKEKIVAPDGGPLDWMYDRRSQFIHSRIVPKGVVDGIPFFNLRHFDKKSTEWDSAYFKEELVEDAYPRWWGEFLGLIAGEWEKLRSRLRDRDTARFEVVRLDIPDIDFNTLKPGDIRISGGPVPPSTILWNLPDVPPSGTR